VVPLLESYDPTSAIIICVFVALIGVFVGRMVQKLVMFVLPKDIITICIILFMLMDIFFLPLYGGITRSVPIRPDIDPLLYLSFLFGYLTGYFINGAQAWTMICMFIAGIRFDDGCYTVLYELKDGTPCIMDQTNRALLKKWIFGIHHKIDLRNGARTLRGRDVKERRKYPILRFKHKKIWLNENEELPPEIRKFLFINMKVRTNAWALADVNQAEQWEVVKSFERLDSLNLEIRRLNTEIDRLNTEIETGITRSAVELSTDMKRGHPVTRYLTTKKKREEEEAELKRKEEEARKAAEALKQAQEAAKQPKEALNDEAKE